MKKTNIPMTLGIATHTDLDGLASTMSGGYRLSGTTDALTAFITPYSEDQAGSYVVRATFADAGIYDIEHNSTDPRIGTHTSVIVVSESNIDDVKLAVDEAKTVIDAIQTQVELFDEESLNGLNVKIDSAITKLDDLGILVNGEGNTAIADLTALLQDIQNNGSSLAALSAKYDDVVAVVSGDEFLSDGTTANPLFGKGLDEIYDAVTPILTGVQAYMDAAKSSIETNMLTMKNSIESRVAEVKAVVDSNSAIVGDAVFGNEALLAAINSTSSTSNVVEIKDLLEDASFGLAALKAAMIDKVNEVKTIVEANGAKLDTLVTRTNISVIG